MGRELANEGAAKRRTFSGNGFPNWSYYQSIKGRPKKVDFSGEWVSKLKLLSLGQYEHSSTRVLIETAIRIVLVFRHIKLS